MLLLRQIVLDFRMTIAILQEPKHCQIVSSMQDTKSCCTGATFSSTNISSRWSCQAPFFGNDSILSILSTFTWNFPLSYDFFKIKWKVSISSREFNIPRKRQGAHLQSMADCCIFHKEYLNGKCPSIAYNCSRIPVLLKHRQHAEKSVCTPVSKIVCEVLF